MNITEHKFYEIKPEKETGFVTKWDSNSDIQEFSASKIVFCPEADVEKYHEITKAKYNNLVKEQEADKAAKEKQDKLDKFNAELEECRQEWGSIIEKINKTEELEMREELSKQAEDASLRANDLLEKINELK